MFMCRGPFRVKVPGIVRNVSLFYPICHGWSHLTDGYYQPVFHTRMVRCVYVRRAAHPFAAVCLLPPLHMFYLIVEVFCDGTKRIFGPVCPQ